MTIKSVSQFSRRRFLSITGLTTMSLGAWSRGQSIEDGVIGDIVIQPDDRATVLYMEVREDLILGDLQYLGHVSNLETQEFYPVKLLVPRGLLQTVNVVEDNTNELGRNLSLEVGSSRAFYHINLRRDPTYESLFHGTLKDGTTGRSLQYFYKDFQPVPIIFVVLGCAAAFCLAAIAFDDCIREAERSCSGSVRKVTTTRVFGIKKGREWDVGCYADCEFECD